MDARDTFSSGCRNKGQGHPPGGSGRSNHSSNVRRSYTIPSAAKRPPWLWWRALLLLRSMRGVPNNGRSFLPGSANA